MLHGLHHQPNAKITRVKNTKTNFFASCAVKCLKNQTILLHIIDTLTAMPHPHQRNTPSSVRIAVGAIKLIILIEKQFRILFVGRNFSSKVALSDHERSNCGNSPIYKCNVCRKSYHSAGTY